ncbi:MAG: hypothetical protein ACRDTJ_28420 [Pseudonocardiaceae bacterium]
MFTSCWSGTGCWSGAVLGAGGARSDNAPLIALVVMAVLLPASIALVVWSYRHRGKPVEQQRESFATQFDGRPIVYFNAYQWSIDEAEARQIAQRCSYQEIAPAYHSRIRWLCFVPGPTR